MASPSPASSLPTEIWIQILEHLCVHCNIPKHSHFIPNLITTDAREGESALRALCLVSRDFRVISQGILFHYFLNSPRPKELGWRRPAVNNNRVTRFLRGLTLSPSLGRQVRILALFYPTHADFPEITRQDLQTWIRISATYNIHVPDEATRALAAQPGNESPLLFFDKPGPDALLLPDAENSWTYCARWLYQWLHVLILNLVPEITHLQLSRPLALDGWKKLQDPRPKFPQVRELTYDIYSSLGEILYDQVAFPNVSGFSAQCLISYITPPQIDVPHLMMNLRKLSISCLPGDLPILLRQCMHLEDLECHIDPQDAVPQAGDHLVQWPSHTKRTLRRLAWSRACAIGWVKKGKDPESVTVVPLRDFERLEILEIDQSSLLMYSRLLKAASISSVLPRTLRCLHIAFIRDVLSPPQIADQFRQLARDKAMVLPKLKIAKVNEPLGPRSKKKMFAVFLVREGVTSVMSDAGVDLRMGWEACPTFEDRSILSQPPGVANALRRSFQVENPPLDGA